MCGCSSSTPERLMLGSGVTVLKHQKHNEVLIQKNKCLYFRLPMQAAIIIIIMVKHSGTVKKIQLYMYIEKGWLRWVYKNNYHTQLKWCRVTDQRKEGQGTGGPVSWQSIINNCFPLWDPTGLSQDRKRNQTRAKGSSEGLEVLPEFLPHCSFQFISMKINLLHWDRSSAKV